VFFKQLLAVLAQRDVRLGAAHDFLRQVGHVLGRLECSNLGLVGIRDLIRVEWIEAQHLTSINVNGSWIDII